MENFLNCDREIDKSNVANLPNFTIISGKYFCDIPLYCAFNGETI
jgi:hypothetical protein